METSQKIQRARLRALEEELVGLASPITLQYAFSHISTT